MASSCKKLQVDMYTQVRTKVHMYLCVPSQKIEREIHSTHQPRRGVCTVYLRSEGRANFYMQKIANRENYMLMKIVGVNDQGRRIVNRIPPRG